MRKKCEARIPNTCYACGSAKHEAGGSLCRVKKQRKYEEEVRITNSEYLFRLRECEARSRRELMQSEKAKEVFGRSVKHEFRIPVTPARVRSTKQARLMQSEKAKEV